MKSFRLWGMGLALMGMACSAESADSGSEPMGAFIDQLRAGPQVRIEGTVTQTNIVSNVMGQARATDPHLKNAWGLAFNPKGPAWVSSAENGTSQVYAADGHTLLEVTIPPPTGGEAPSPPTGQVFNWAASSAFMGDLFIFVTEDGTVAGWQPSAEGTAQLRADRSSDMANYKGVAIATPFTRGGRPHLFAANFHAGSVDVWDDQYAPASLPGAFRDADLPAGYAPFNLMGVGPFLLVSYALQDDDKKDDVRGAGHGFVDLFTADGFFVQRLISGGALDSPWGMVFAPDNDRGSIDLAIGNFGDGRINIYDLSLKHGRIETRFEGALGNACGTALVIDGLWALAFGPGAGGFAADHLYFTAGPNNEEDGLFGSLVFSGTRR